MNLNYMKAFVTTVMSLVASMLGVLYIPVLLMVACNVIDYVTGIWAAGYRQDGGVSSYCSMCGIIKKVTMWLLVFVGAIIDAFLLPLVRKLKTTVDKMGGEDQEE